MKINQRFYIFIFLCNLVAAQDILSNDTHGNSTNQRDSDEQNTSQFLIIYFWVAVILSPFFSIGGAVHSWRDNGCDLIEIGYSIILGIATAWIWPLSLTFGVFVLTCLCYDECKEKKEKERRMRTGLPPAQDNTASEDKKVDALEVGVDVDRSRPEESSGATRMALAKI